MFEESVGFDLSGFCSLSGGGRRRRWRHIRARQQHAVFSAAAAAFGTACSVDDVDVDAVDTAVSAAAEVASRC